VLTPDIDVTLPESAERLAAYLALADRPQPRDNLANTLWPDRDESEARAAVRRALWQLNRAVPGLIQRSGQYLSLALGVDVDLREVHSMADAVAAGELEHISAGGVRLLEGDLLPQWSFEWLDSCRESLRQLRLHTLEALARASLDAGRPGPALTVALAAVGVDPLRESAHRIVIAAHLLEDNSAAALRQYAQYRDLLWNDMRLRPSRQMQGLITEACGPVGGIETLRKPVHPERAAHPLAANTGTRG